LKEKHEIPELDPSNFKINLNKVTDFIQNISKYWESGSTDIKKRMQKTVFPSGYL